MQNKYQERIAKIRKTMAEQGLDGFYINDIYNVSYLTGTKGNDLTLYLTANEAWIITDFRYEEMAAKLSWLTLYKTGAGRNIHEFLKTRSEKNIGIELMHLPLNTYLKFKNEQEGKEFVPVNGIIEPLRSIKDQDELDATAKAEAIGDAAFEKMLGIIKPGMTEKEVATELEYQLRRAGADGLSFDTIIASGENSSLPHAVPTDRKLREGDFVTMDFGCKYNLYCSDMTRTIAIGKPSDEMVEIYNIVLKAQLNACANIHAGITGVEGDAYARKIIEEAGYGANFGHSLGHSTGLFIHEAPNFSPNYQGIVYENSVLSIEPGIYLSGRFGVRIEDLAIVKADGIINLTHSAKELLIL